MENVLVTGGAGYIGSHASKELALSGFRPIVYDDLTSGHRHAVKWGPLEVGNVRDVSRLDSVLDRYRPVAVMHFAASSEVGQSCRDPLGYWGNNVGGTLSLVERCVRHRVHSLIFSSTCAIYGIPDTLPLIETTPTAPINPYGETKLAVERMLRSASAANALNIVALRYFNAAGASCDGEIGEEHDPETHLIPLVLKAAADPTRQVNVFGADYPTRDGTCVRDFVHVEDLAVAHVSALERLLRDELTGFQGINLGTGRGLSVLEILAEARRVTGQDIRVNIGGRRAGDPASLVADATMARKTLNWLPMRSDVSNLIGSAWAWEKKRTHINVAA